MKPALTRSSHRKYAGHRMDHSHGEDAGGDQEQRDGEEAAQQQGPRDSKQQGCHGHGWKMDDHVHECGSAPELQEDLNAIGDEHASLIPSSVSSTRVSSKALSSHSHLESGSVDEEKGHFTSTYVPSHSHSHSHLHGPMQPQSHEGHQEESLAMKAAMIHVIGDIVQSLGVMFASILIWVEPFPIGTTADGVSNWNYADPLCTVLFACLVMATTKSTIISITQSLMHRTPDKYVVSHVRASLADIPHALDAHDIHIWEIGRTPVCSAHVTVDAVADVSAVLKACIKVMTEKYGIEHTTVQIEIAGEYDHTTEKYGRLHDHSFCCGP